MAGLDPAIHVLLLERIDVDARQRPGMTKRRAMLQFPSSDIGMFGRRQRHVRGHRIPVTITREARNADARNVVVLDTFGSNDVTPLPGGCACCTVRVELQSALRKLMNQPEKMQFSRVVIATQHELAPTLRTFVTEKALGTEFYIEEDSPPAAFGTEADGIRHFMLAEPVPLSWDAFSRFISTLTALRGTDLLHMRGLLNVAGCGGPVAIHVMQHLAQRPVELQTWPTGERASRLDFVTRNIEAQVVRSLFDSVRALG